METIFEIDLFGLLQSERLKNTWLLLEHTNNQGTMICMNIDAWKILRSYTNLLINVSINSSIKQLAMVSNPEEFTDKSTFSPDQSETAKNPSAGKSLSKFSDISCIKQKTTVCRLGYAKSKNKATISENTLRPII